MVALPQFTLLAVKDGAGYRVPALTPVELDQDAPPVGLTLHISEQVRRSLHPAKFGDRPA